MGKINETFVYDVLNRIYVDEVDIYAGIVDLCSCNDEIAYLGIVQLLGYYENREEKKDPFILNSSLLVAAIDKLKNKGGLDGAYFISKIISDESFKSSQRYNTNDDFQTHEDFGIDAILSMGLNDGELVDAFAYMRLAYPDKVAAVLEDKGIFNEPLGAQILTM